mmetsp:Transcript_8056/g.22534  ORF Transcript_8056/g.22534 Transcript_8056/m.22534 type:complete len:100 (+) Transcript_8056:905-1204(+)
MSSSGICPATCEVLETEVGICSSASMGASSGCWILDFLPYIGWVAPHWQRTATTGNITEGALALRRRQIITDNVRVLTCKKKIAPALCASTFETCTGTF